MLELSYRAVNPTWGAYIRLQWYISGEEIMLAEHDVERATALLLARSIAEKYEKSIMRQRNRLDFRSLRNYRERDLVYVPRWLFG
jgi:hypothetical protein